MGLWSPALRFARAADERADTFDQLVALAPELWDLRWRLCLTAVKDTALCCVLAGWSEERGRVEMRALQEIGDDSGFSQDLLIYAAGPAEPSASCREFADIFCKRSARDPEAI